MTAITQIEPAAAPQASTPDAITPMHMLQVAMEKGADLDRLQQLMGLQERWEANGFTVPPMRRIHRREDEDERNRDGYPDPPR